MSRKSDRFLVVFSAFLTAPASGRAGLGIRLIPKFPPQFPRPWRPQAEPAFLPHFAQAGAFHEPIRQGQRGLQSLIIVQFACTDTLAETGDVRTKNPSLRKQYCRIGFANGLPSGRPANFCSPRPALAVACCGRGRPSTAGANRPPRAHGRAGSGGLLAWSGRLVLQHQFQELRKRVREETLIAIAMRVGLKRATERLHSW
jgi:hypothetical protein